MTLAKALALIVIGIILGASAVLVWASIHLRKNNPWGR